MNNRRAGTAKTASLFSQTIKKTQMGGTTYTKAVWPPKYEPRRERLKDIPKECIEKLLTAIDQDLDGKIGFEELLEFAKKMGNPLSSQKLADMFKEIADRRAVVFVSQISSPITIDELVLCFKGRYSWDEEQQKFKATYRPYYEEWVKLLQLVNPKIYTAPPRTFEAKKIVAQYEVPNPYRPKSYTQYFGKVEEKVVPCFEKKDFNEEMDRLRGSTLYQIVDNKVKVREKVHGYETVTNSKIFTNKQGPPKVTFDSRETYEEALRLSKTHALYTDESKNPIHRYIPTNKRAKSAITGKRMLEERVQKSENHEQKTFYTAFKIEDCAGIKARVLKECPITDPYAPQCGIRFRNTQPHPDKPLFKLRFKCPPPSNPLGISEHDRRPREAILEEEKARVEEIRRRQIEYEEEFKGKTLTKKEWQNCFKLPDKLHAVGDGTACPLIDRTGYVDPITQIAKQLRDDVVIGKPLFQKYTRPLKPEDLNYEMGGTFKPFKVMH